MSQLFALGRSSLRPFYWKNPKARVADINQASNGGPDGKHGGPYDLMEVDSGDFSLLSRAGHKIVQVNYNSIHGNETGILYNPCPFNRPRPVFLYPFQLPQKGCASRFRQLILALRQRATTARASKTPEKSHAYHSIHCERSGFCTIKMIPAHRATLVWMLGLFAICSIFGTKLCAGESIDLNAAWRFQLDPSDRGVNERWFERILPASIKLPGTLPENGIGDPIGTDTQWTGSIFDKSWFTAPEYARYRQPGNIKIPFWLQPETHYVGAAWFQRDVEIPSTWSGRHLVLFLERPHWKTTVWVDAREIGSNDSLSVPHQYEIGSSLSAGHHVLTIRVDNTLVPDIGENSHSVSDHTQGNWNGIVGRIAIDATATAWVDELQISPRIADRTAIIRGRVMVSEGHRLPQTVQITGESITGVAGPMFPATIGADGTFSLEYTFGIDTVLWDEFTPALQRIVATLENGERREAVFGFREMVARGRVLTINGHPLFLRGTLDCAAFPRTGHPPLEVNEWKRQLLMVKSYGLNHVRFHSWCPPEAAFIAADEIGVYLQIEVSTWPNQSTTIGDGKPVDSWVNRETSRILHAYGNHPSFIMLCAGNEPGGANHVAWLSAWVASQKAADSRRLYTAGAGWPEVAENDYQLTAEPRIQHWNEGLGSRINRLAPETRTDYRDYILERKTPVVSHEIGQWCVYPNFAEIPKYTGYLKPRNFEIFREHLAAHHLADQAHDFVIASGKLQALCYKEDIESALRTPFMAGFQLLGLSDFPGQGTALVGVLDAFWEKKEYISASEFSHFCNSTVPLARMEKRVFTTDEHLVADVEVAHFGAAPLLQAVATWKLVDQSGATVAGGKFQAQDISLGNSTALGRIDLNLNTLHAPARYRMVVSVAGTVFENSWDLWVYPPAAEAIYEAGESVSIVHEFNDSVRGKLEAGETVVLMIPPSKVQFDPRKGQVALGFSSIFWNTAWTHGQAPHTLGILCDPSHPALASFPTEAWSNWQWWYPVTHASAMILDGLPAELHPIVQVIDDWVTNRKLALVFEARVGSGRLLVTSIDLSGAALDPVRRQLRTSILRYAASPSFHPTTMLTPAQISSLIIP
jgi:Glycosyl hydrolases family 2, sugar binding domain